MDDCRQHASTRNTVSGSVCWKDSACPDVPFGGHMDKPDGG